MNRFNKKRFIFCFILCAIVAIGFFVLYNNVSAQTPPPPPPPPPPAASTEGIGFGEFLSKAVAAPALYTVAGILYIIQGVAVFILELVAAALNQAFWWNITLFPSNMLVVLKGWTALRDIANAFFILIILWIAFTIIFNFEQLGGRKLLVRVIAVALLINFSLALVTFVFGIANVLASSIAEKMPKNIGAYIAAETRLHTIFRAPTAEELGNYENYKKSAAKEADKQAEGSQKEAEARLFTHALVSAVGSPVAEAQAVSTKTVATVACGIGGIVGFFFPPAGAAIIPAIAFGCGTGAAGYFAFLSTAKALGGLVNFGFHHAFDTAIVLFISIIFLLLTIMAMAYAALALIIRIIIEIILAVTAPAAFLFAVIPGKITSQYWNMWLSYLFRWAFFAPIFYFLLYLALYMVQRPETQTADSIPPLAGFDVDSILQITFPLILIWMGVSLSRKTGGAIAQTVIDYGKKYGKRALMAGAAVASGGASLAAGKGIAALSTATATGTERITGVLSKISQTPYVGRATGPALRRATEYLAGRREGVDQYYGRIQSRSAEDVAIDFRTRAPSISPDARIAGVRRLGELNRLELLSDEEIRETINLSRQYGLEREFAKLRPDLAIPVEINIQSDDAKNQIHTMVEKLKTEEISRVDLRTLGGYRKERVIDRESAEGREQIEKEHTVRETVLKEIFLTGDSEKLGEIVKAITRLPKELRFIYQSEIRDILRTQQNWNTLESENPIMHSQLIQYIASNPGQRIVAGFELPAEIKQKLEEIREQQRGKKQGQRTDGFGGA